MSEIVNLRQVRKTQKKHAAAAEAAENRLRFGRSKAQRSGEEKVRDRAERVLDNAKITPLRGSDIR